jgi:excisionase family DNA binding protein
MSIEYAPGVAPERVLLDVDDVQAVTGHSRSYIYALMASGQLKWVKAGRRRLVRRGDLEAYIASLTSEVPDV